MPVSSDTEVPEAVDYIEGLDLIDAFNLFKEFYRLTMLWVVSNN